jgi:vacuole morphology and inheritance protein 14
MQGNGAGGAAAGAQDLLSSGTLKLIGDPRYEKRKAAALEVEQVVKRLASAGDHARVRALVDRLISEFAFSPAANHRKGALLCLAAAAVGLGDAPGGEQHLRQIVPPILASFTDQDARVRYYGER